MSNYVKAVLILNAKKKSSKKCPECGSMMKNGECPECDSEEMTENAKKGGKSKGWTEEARKKAAMTRKRKSGEADYRSKNLKSTVSYLKDRVKATPAHLPAAQEYKRALADAEGALSKLNKKVATQSGAKRKASIAKLSEAKVAKATKTGAKRGENVSIKFNGKSQKVKVLQKLPSGGVLVKAPDGSKRLISSDGYKKL